LREIENDPEAHAALRRAQTRLRAFGELLKDPEFRRERERARREQEQAFQALAHAIRESMRAAQGDLKELGFAPPKTLEEWEHLARVVEVPLETIKAGNFTARDVYDMALAWVDQQQMKSRVGGNGEPSSHTLAATPTEPPASAPTAKADPELRSWTQKELDKAIRQYKAERAASYADLLDAVRRNKPGAKKKAQEIYGRNAIARALGVKAKAMVSKSPA
jgi:hypothetical protein